MIVISANRLRTVIILELLDRRCWVCFLVGWSPEKLDFFLENIVWIVSLLLGTCRVDTDKRAHAYSWGKKMSSFECISHIFPISTCWGFSVNAPSVSGCFHRQRCDIRSHRGKLPGESALYRVTQPKVTFSNSLTRGLLIRRHKWIRPRDNIHHVMLTMKYTAMYLSGIWCAYQECMPLASHYVCTCSCMLSPIVNIHCIIYLSVLLW